MKITENNVVQQLQKRNEAVRLPVNNGKIILDHKDPLHRMLMDDFTSQNTTPNASHTPD